MTWIGRAVRARERTRLQLGPIERGGRSVVLRAPRFDDYTDWRALRLQDEEYIEPFWVTERASWRDRHTERRWRYECISRHRRMVRGEELMFVIEVDGEFAGQCGLVDLDRRAGSGELSVWNDSQFSRTGIAATATAMLVDYAFDDFGLHRVTAMARVDNVRALTGLQRGGMQREAVLENAFDAGGVRGTYELWSIIAESRPRGGFAQFYRDPHGENTGTARHTDRIVERSYLSPSALGVQVRYILGQTRRAMRRRRVGDLGDPGRAVWLRARRRRIRTKSVHPEFDIVVHGDVIGQCGIRTTDAVRRTADLWFADLPGVDRFVVGAALGLMLDFATTRLGAVRVSVTLSSEGDCLEQDMLKEYGFRYEGRLRSVPDGRGSVQDRELWAWTTAEE